MKNTTLNIARDGQVLGPIEAGKLPDYLESGYILKTDHYYDEASEEWVPVTQWKPTVSTAFRPPDSKESAPSTSPQAEIPTSSGSSRQRHRSSSSSSPSRSKKASKQTLTNLSGWIACLFALVVGAGIWAWAQSVNDRLRISQTEGMALNTQISLLKKENQALTEIAPPKHIRGVLAYQMSPEQVGISSGVTVALYPREVIEKSLADLSQNIDGKGFQEILESWRTVLPPPAMVTMTDANGRFDLSPPDEKEYVIVTSASRRVGEGSDQSVWLAGVRSSDNPTPLILLNEKNAISPSSPKFNIWNFQTFSSGESP